MKFSLVLPTLVLVAMFFSSCADEDFEDPAADPRDKFSGSWICKETIGTSAPQTFTIYITSYGSADSLRISNFSGYGNTAVALALVSGSNLLIPSQQIGITNIPIQGSGAYSSQGGNEKINLNYTVDGNSASAVCTR